MGKAENTRLNILKKAFQMIYHRGYQTTSIDDIIATTSVTKGAFYYHFKNKEEMGLSIVRDLLQPGMYQAIVTPLTHSDNAVRDIYKVMDHILLHDPFFEVQYGCPAVNLIDEMGPVSQSFSELLTNLMRQWKNAMIGCLERSKEQGIIRAEINALEVAIFILSGYGGIRNLGKIEGVSCYKQYLRGLQSYLQSLI